MMAQRKKEASKNRGPRHQGNDNNRRNEVQERRNPNKPANRPILKKDAAIVLRNDQARHERAGHHQHRQYCEAQHGQNIHRHNHPKGLDHHPERQAIQRSFSRDSYSTITTAAETPADSHLALAMALAFRSDTSSSCTSLPTEIFVPNEPAFYQALPMTTSTSAAAISPSNAPILIQSENGSVEEYLLHGSVLASISQVSPNTPTTMDMINSFSEDDNTYPSWLLEGGDWDFGRREHHASFVSENTNTTLSTHDDDPHLMFVTRLEI